MSQPNRRYEIVVGLEVHAQLTTNSKIFSAASARFGANPNTQVDPVTLGHPGTLPVLNRKVIDYALRLCLALKCEVTTRNEFARKNYFYADLPKGYQITQHTTPIGRDGELRITTGGRPLAIGITRIHMEEDAGKSLHDWDHQDSLIDLNRAGVPLLEIVSEPDFRSSSQAAIYLAELRRLLRYLEICDGNMEEGSLRCDANISVRPVGQSQLGNRCEVKNLNSIKNVQRAIDFEASRQIAIMEDGGTIEQNTLSFDAASGRTSVLRSKEMANDYRYFPEPDLLPVLVTSEMLERIKAEMPVLPEVLFSLYTRQYALSEQDANALIDQQDLGSFFFATAGHSTNYKAIVNWLVGSLRSYLNEQSKGIYDIRITPQQLASFISLIDSGKVNHTMAAGVLLPAMIASPEEDLQTLAQSLGVLIEENGQLDKWIDQSIKKFPDKVDAYRQGKKGVLGLFMGEVMKLSKGKIDPQEASARLVTLLNEFT